MLSLRKTLFQRVKKMIPRISDTEMIALQCGTTSIDRELFEGKVKKQNFQPMKQQMFEKELLDELLSNILVNIFTQIVTTNRCLISWGRISFFRF